ncbi:protein translocase SEC61 complex subunit gamma [Candidatus Micrarchaeota archaeon]|nr:protein translocase SEC61 complex subunit gamma [Candidatus Micrarchaeota archaeon]
MEFTRLMKRIMKILYIAKKPTNKEFYQIARITGAGMLVVGAVGMLLYLLFQVI